MNLKDLIEATNREGVDKMNITEETLKNDIELAKGIGQLAESVNQAISILAKAILELEDPEENHFLRLGTRQALQSLAETADRE